VKLRYTLPALSDLDEILDYVTARSPQGAARIQARVQTVIDLLLQLPLAGAPTRGRACPFSPTTNGRLLIVLGRR